MITEKMIEAVPLPDGWKYWVVACSDADVRILIELIVPEGVSQSWFPGVLEHMPELCVWQHSVERLGALFGRLLSLSYTGCYYSAATRGTHIIYKGYL